MLCGGGGGGKYRCKEVEQSAVNSSGCFSSSKIGVVSQTHGGEEKVSLPQDADSGSPSPASLPLTQPYPPGNPPCFMQGLLDD